MNTPGFTCPQCGMTSHNPNDIAEGYCGNCHNWTDVAAEMREYLDLVDEYIDRTYTP